MSKVGKLPQIDMNAKDEINYLVAGLDSTLCIKESEVEGKKL